VLRLAFLRRRGLAEGGQEAVKDRPQADLQGLP
jgi:hypothetical protein